MQRPSHQEQFLSSKAHTSLIGIMLSLSVLCCSYTYTPAQEPVGNSVGNKIKVHEGPVPIDKRGMTIGEVVKLAGAPNKILTNSPKLNDHIQTYVYDDAEFVFRDGCMINRMSHSRISKPQRTRLGKMQDKSRAQAELRGYYDIGNVRYYHGQAGQKQYLEDKASGLYH